MTLEAYIDDQPVIEDDIDAYKRLVDIARDARKERDEQYWIMGQCAILLEIHYAKHTLATFANEIGVEPRRIYEYKIMTEFYPLDIRERLKPLNLTYSHMREAKRLGTIEQAIEFLHQIAESLWTVHQTRERMNIMLGRTQSAMSQDERAALYTPPMLQNFHPVFESIMTIRQDGTISLDTPLPPDFEKGKRYRVIFEPIED